MERSYDDNGNVTEVRVNNPAGGGMTAAVKNVYNKRNQLVQSRDAFGNGYTYSYDPCGRLTSRVDARGEFVPLPVRS